jgi:5'-methylthioadenosine phosphorylase
VTARQATSSVGEAAIGVIGGSGLYELEGLSDVTWQKIRTPFGDPSDAYCVGRFAGRRVVFLPRHGRGHRVAPSDLNFRANIWGLRSLGVQWVISISAVGSMKEAIRPLDLVIPDQFFDATKRRVSSFFGDGIVAHIGMAEPVCPDLAAALDKAAHQTAATVHRGGTYICIEGPQFSTKAESRIYRSWGVDVIGMTNMPEAKLAREAELCYATLALATDYDVWHETHEAVTVEAVIQNLLKNVATAKDVLRRVLPAIAPPRTCPCPSLLANAGITAPNVVPPATRKKLALFLDKYWQTEKRRSRDRSRAASGSGHPRSKPASRTPLQNG